jgi:REP-associated tyrosine transposase
MPRGPRLDYPGALHHVICRGIERRAIFRSDGDRRAFLDRLAALVQQANAGLYAWAFMPNHAHVLVRTGTVPLSQLAQRWLGSYATTFNLVHRRAGHLFQGRFKNVLVEEDPYFLELVRYIHLNPVRSRLPVTIDTLDTYPWTGHAVLLGKTRLAAQDSSFVLGRFAADLRRARIAYRNFVREGVSGGSLPDLEGGGLRRSSRGWELVANLKRGRELWEFDERVLGSSEFVRETLERIGDGGAPRPRVDPICVLEPLCERVACRFSIAPAELCSASKRQEVLDARAILSYLAVRHHGLSFSAVARHLNVARQSIARGLVRAQRVFGEHGNDLVDFLES